MIQPSNHHITVTFPDGQQRTFPYGTLIRSVAERESRPDGQVYLGALVNNEVVSLTYPLEVDSEVSLLTLADSHGWRIYRRSVSFLLAKAIHELFPAANFSVEHSLGTGLYCNFDLDGHAGISEIDLKRVEMRMQELVRQDLPIERSKVAFTTALQQFEQEGQTDKFNLLRFRNPAKIVINWCDGFSDLAHGPMAARTGHLARFRLIPYPPGFVLQLPDRETPDQMPRFEPQPHLFQIFREHKEWGRILGVNTVGRLNEIIASGEIDDFIRISEALHEKKIVQIADHISSHRHHLRWLLIAGPSSSGKTTFAKRLAIQLRVNGLRPVTISVDDYFVDRESTPRDENGDYDFEDLATIDLPLLHEHLRALEDGSEISIPSFNFEKGAREMKEGRTLRLEPDDMVIVEGIHALNPRLTEVIAPEHKFRIYISALTQLNLDAHNRISTTDNRLVRRLVRDNAFRGNPALGTLQMWPRVRRGEKRWIFPFQQEADIAFNSALDYELAVLKYFVEPLLAEVKPIHPQYAEARRLQDFLASFLGISASRVPPTSILREFIGRSSFRY